MISLTPSVQILTSLGEFWAEMLSAVQRGYATRAELSEKLGRLRGLFSDVFDELLLRMSIDEGKDKVGDRCHTRWCADCLDKFTCLTENIGTILRCRRCGLKWFYPVKGNANGDWFVGRDRIEGSESYCPLAVCGEPCPRCGEVDGRMAHNLKYLLRDIAREQAGGRLTVRLSKDVLYRPISQEYFDSNGSLNEFRGRSYEEYHIQLRAMYEVLCKAKISYVMTLGDFVGLLYPEPDEFRGCSWENYDAAHIGTSSDPMLEKYIGTPLTTDTQRAIVSDLANQWMLPPRNLQEAMTIRDKGDPCQVASELRKNIAFQQLTIAELPPDYFMQKVFGEKYNAQSMGCKVEEVRWNWQLSALPKMGLDPVKLLHDTAAATDDDCDE